VAVLERRAIGTRFLFYARGGGYEMMNAALSL
jgi:hypothetical protein